jgi:hypothetical protein
MARIRQVLARVFVESLDDALPLYERLAEGVPVRRFKSRNMELGWVGPFLLLAGSSDALEAYRDRVASLVVEGIQEIAREIVDAGGQLVEGPAPAPTVYA